MKARYGFVSNSSTTSFTLFGLRIEEDLLIDIFGTKEPFKTISLFPKSYDQIVMYENYEDDVFFLGLIVGGEEEHDQMSTQMLLDETRRQFQDRIIAAIKSKMTNPNRDDLVFDYHNYSHYDG